jgi:hypothetical protein
LFNGWIKRQKGSKGLTMEKSRTSIGCSCCTTHSYAEEWKWEQRIKDLGNGSKLMYCYNIDTDKPGNSTCVDITCPVCGATRGIRITSIDDLGVEECKERLNHYEKIK